MKEYFVTLILASALSISVVITSQKAQAQITGPQSTDKTSATIADAAGAKTNNPGAPGFGAASEERYSVKDSKKYAETGGWGYAHFNDGKPADESFMQKLLPLPPRHQISRRCLHPLRTLAVAMQLNMR